MSKNSWSGSAADWDQRFEVGDVVADPSGSWEPSSAQQYIDQQVATLNTGLASEAIARQTGDRNLQTNLTSEMNTRASQDANLNALINAGIREGGGVQFDIVPTQNSANGITSGGMYSTLKDSNIGFVDETPTVGSNNLVKSGGIYSLLPAKKETVRMSASSAVYLPFLDNKKVLMKAVFPSGFTTSLRSGSTALAMGLYDEYLYCDFSNYSNINAIYSNQTVDVDIYYIDNPSVLDIYLNGFVELDESHVFSEVKKGHLYVNSTMDAILFKQDEYGANLVFPIPSPNYHSRPLGVNNIFKIGGELYLWGNGQLLKYNHENSPVVYSANNSGGDTVVVDIPLGTYTYKLKNESNFNGYLGMRFFDEDGIELKWHIGISVVNANSSVSGSIYFEKPVKSVIFDNPNGLSASISIVVSKENYGKDYDILVAADGSGDYRSLHEAIINADDNRYKKVTIFVKPGNYYMPVRMNEESYVYKKANRNLAIIGADKNSCIIYNDSGYYNPTEEIDESTIQLSGKITLKNLTIKNTSENFVQRGSSTEPSAYCVHGDYAAWDDSVFEIDNCILYNDHYACFAVCPRNNGKLIVKNCVAKTIVANPSSEEFAWEGICMSHGTAGVTNQYFEFFDNLFETNGKAFAFSSDYDVIINTTFIRNAVFAGTRIIKWGDTNVRNSSQSCLNNASILDYSE